MWPSPKETSGDLPRPPGYSGSHFSATACFDCLFDCFGFYIAILMLNCFTTIIYFFFIFHVMHHLFHWQKIQYTDLRLNTKQNESHITMIFNLSVKACRCAPGLRISFVYLLTYWIFWYHKFQYWLQCACTRIWKQFLKLAVSPRF